MASTDQLLPFVLATLVFAVVPGPAILYTAAQTMARGRRGGLMAALGIHIGGLAHVAAAAAGLSAVFEFVPELYAAVKLLGALYLLWLGYQMIRGEKDRAEAVPSGKGARRAFMESILVEALNPKAALFYLAFLPQFVDPGAALPLWAQFLILGWVVNMTFSAADLVTIWLTGLALNYARSTGLAARTMRILGGCTLMGLGARLAFLED
jgi:threonine/homoserine/homoserine lactone efflux protein